MILLGSRLLNLPIMSLQTGSELAKTKQPVIDPASLKIIAYEIDGPLLEPTQSLLRLADVRELSDIGMIIDSSDEFVSSSDVITLKDVYDLQFRLLGMQVRDEKGGKLGKISDYTIETDSFIIQQLTVKRPFLKSFSDTELLIHRSQIIEINNESIVVHSESKVDEREVAAQKGSYVNPFRKQPSPQSIDLDRN